MGYKVTAAYVTLRVKNDLDQEVLLGYYEGAVLPEGVNEDDLQRHIRKGMVAEEGTEEAEAATPFGKPVTFDAAGMPVTEPPKPASDRGQRTDGKPAGNASRDDWAAYAATKGAPEEETRAQDEGGLSRDDLRAKYGS
jgi:hypothetical protein